MPATHFMSIIEGRIPHSRSRYVFNTLHLGGILNESRMFLEYYFQENVANQILEIFYRRFPNTIIIG